MKLNDRERKVLVFLADQYNSEGAYWSFHGIKQHVRLPRNEIRLACRSLKRKGLTKFLSGLWTEDGEMAGSGYSATQAGTEFLKQAA